MSTLQTFLWLHTMNIRSDITIWLPETREEFTVWALEFAWCSHETHNFEELFFLSHIRHNLELGQLGKLERWIEFVREQFPDLVDCKLVDQDKEYMYYRTRIAGVLVQNYERVMRVST